MPSSPGQRLNAPKASTLRIQMSYSVVLHCQGGTFQCRFYNAGQPRGPQCPYPHGNGLPVALSHRLPLIPDIPEGVLPIGTPCEPTRKDYVYITGYRARKIYGPPTRPSGLRTPKAAGIPPLLRLSLTALVPPMLTETITPSYPVAGDRSVRLGPCTTRHLARARERSKS